MATESPKPGNSNVDWNDYNFPPLLKLFHFSLNDLVDPGRGVAKKIFIEWIMFISILAFNFISTVVLVADGA
jgi:hypothetical protein